MGLSKRGYALAMCVCALLFVSCDKDNGDDITPGELREIPEFTHTCDSLIHIEGVAPTVTTDGVYEHRHCKKCNKNYADADGKTPFEGSIVCPAVCHQIPRRILDMCNESMPWNDNLTPTKVGIGTVAQKIIGIYIKVRDAKFQTDVTKILTIFAR